MFQRSSKMFEILLFIGFILFMFKGTIFGFLGLYIKNKLRELVKELIEDVLKNTFNENKEDKI
jgi:hypothetical protein